VVTGMNMFFRSAGSAVGVAAFGAIVNATLGSSAVDGGVAPEALTTAVHHVFVATAVLAGVMLAAAVLMPRDRGRTRPPVPESAEVAAG
jgi:hypothetical protein